MNKSTLSVLLLAILLLFIWQTPDASDQKQILNELSARHEKLRVAASFYPLAHFAKEVGGDYVEVFNVTPAGAEPHEYVPTPGDMRMIWISRLFILNGAGLDPWAKRVAGELEEKGTQVLIMEEYFDLHGDGKGEDNSTYDPHTWLDPVLAVTMVEIVRDALIKADPSNEDGYRKGSDIYIKKLKALHNRYIGGLKSCRRREIIVGHDAFRYLAKRYNIEVFPISGITPEEEPTPQRLMKAVRLARKKGIKYIFSETLASTRLSRTIADEIGAGMLILNPLGGLTDEEMRSGESYLSVMEKNLQNLRLALSCK